MSHFAVWFAMPPGVGSNSLHGTIQSEVGALTRLTYLDLHYAGLTGSIPTAVSQFSNLSFLDLSYNSLTGSIPSSFAALSKLRKCFFSGFLLNF